MFRPLLRLLAVLAISFGLASAAATDAVLIKTFHHAVQIGNTSTVRTMLSADPTLARSSDQYRFQPIHLLDMYFSEEILDLLLADGADINARNDEGVTLLHIVTDPDAVAVLVRKGADIEVRDKRGWTPLIMQASE